MSLDKAPERDRLTREACPLSDCHTYSTGLLFPPSLGISVFIVFQVSCLFIWQSFTEYEISPSPHGRRPRGVDDCWRVKEIKRIEVSDAMNGDRNQLAKGLLAIFGSGFYLTGDRETFEHFKEQSEHYANT